jgi:hypothetical protein
MRLTRLDLLQAAFTVLFGEIKRDKGESTPWTTQQLYRGASLCVVLHRVLTRFDELRAQGRIGSHSLEGHFGVLRVILRGDDRWEQWLTAEVRAELGAEDPGNSVDHTIDLERSVELARLEHGRWETSRSHPATSRISLTN